MSNNLVSVYIVTHIEEPFFNTRLPILFLNSPTERLYTVLVKDDEFYRSINSGTVLIINADDNGIPILHESDGLHYYLTSDNIRLQSCIEFGSLMGKVNQFYVQYCNKHIAQ